MRRARGAGTRRGRPWRHCVMLAPPCLFLLAFAACGPEGHREALPDLEHEAEAAEAGAAHAGETEAEEHGETAATGAGPGASMVVEGRLREIPSDPAVGFTGPGGEAFRVALRTPEIGYFPCVSCHIRPIGTKSITLAQMHYGGPEHEGATRIDCFSCHDPGSPRSLRLDCANCHEREGVRDLMPSRTVHPTIELGHPGGRYRNCLTCHAPENPGLLALQDGGRATLDEAYRLCAGCHFMQAADWAGGAHGKRLAGWQGERLILSCTGCHDPHHPKFPVRRPVTFPKIARREALK